MTFYDALFVMKSCMLLIYRFKLVPTIAEIGFQYAISKFYWWFWRQCETEMVQIHVHTWFASHMIVFLYLHLQIMTALQGMFQITSPRLPQIHAWCWRPCIVLRLTQADKWKHSQTKQSIFVLQCIFYWNNHKTSEFIDTCTIITSRELYK